MPGSPIKADHTGVSKVWVFAFQMLNKSVKEKLHGVVIRIRLHQRIHHLALGADAAYYCNSWIYNAQRPKVHSVLLEPRALVVLCISKGRLVHIPDLFTSGHEVNQLHGEPLPQKQASCAVA